nr:hypothetical protein [Tanacetum cinerariifolium]
MDIFAFIHTLDPTKRLKASVERLFDEGGSGNQMEQGDSARGGPDANIQLVVEVANTVVEDAALVQSRHQGKRKSMVVDAGEVFHPPKMLRVDHGTPSEASIGASVSTTLEREDGDHIDSVAEPNLCTIGAPSFVRIMTTVTSTTLTVDPTLVTKKKFVEPSPFGVGSSFADGTDPIMGVFSDLTDSDFLAGSIRTIINPDTDLQKVYVPQWSLTNGSRIDDDRFYHEMVDEFAPLKFFTAEVRIHAEYNVKEKRRLKYVVENQGELLKDREEEIESLKARLLLKEADVAEAIRLDVKVTGVETLVVSKELELIDLNALVTSVKSQNDNLAERIHELEISSYGLQEKVTVYENFMKQLEKFQDDRMKVFNDKFDKIWLLTQGMKLAIIKCLNSPEYLYAFGAAIGKAIKKADYISALQQLQNVNFPLLVEFISNKDASIEAVMNILCLEGPLAEKLGLDKLQPNVDQLTVPIHHSPDKVVNGATALSLALDVSNIHVRKIKENISNQRSSLHDVFVPLSEPLSAAVLTGTKDNYKVIDAEDQAAANGNAASFPNVDDAELNIKSRFIFKASLFCTKSTSAVLNVGMSISTRMIASVPYVNENGVSPLLDFIMAIGLRMFNGSKVLADA